MKSKKFLSILLALALCVGLLPGAALAEDGSTYTGTIEIRSSVMELFGQPVDLMSLDDKGKVPLKDSSAVKWIDRLDLTGEDYAMPFYDWLVENSDGDGVEDALIEPATGEVLNTVAGPLYYHTITQLTGEVPFTFDPEASGPEIEQAARDAISAETAAQIDTIAAFTYEALHAFDRDHPEVFWLSKQAQITSLSGFQYSYADRQDGCGTVTYNISVCFILKYGLFDIRTDDAEDIREDIAERDAAVEAILAGLDPDASRYEQIRYLNKWLTENNGYNTSYDLNRIDEECYECISALEGESGKDGPVCEGYARAFMVLCDRLGIPCVLVDGTCNGGGHMWNYVQMEDHRWYAVDMTWNDPVAPGIFAPLSGYEREDYLLVGGETMIDGEAFLQSHPVSNLPSSGATTPCYLNGPILNDTAFDPNAEVVHVHEYDYGSVVFEWAEDYSACAASVTCTLCDAEEEGHTLAAECTVTSTSADGDMTITASATLNGETVSDERHITAQIGEDTFTLTLPESAAHMTVVVAYYDSNGLMTGCKLFTASEDEIQAAISGQSVLVFFLSDDAAPHPLFSVLPVR